MKRTKKLPGKAELLVCGAGIDFPSDITLGTLRALAACDSVVYIHKDRERLLGLLKHVEPAPAAVFPPASGPVPGWAAAAARLRKGEKVAYLTYGHPLVFSDGAGIAAKARAEGWKVRVLPAVSAVDRSLALLFERKGVSDWSSYTVADAGDLVSGMVRPDGVTALALLCADAAIKAYGERFFKALSGVYPDDYPVYLLHCADIMGPESFSSLTAGGLRAAASSIGHRSTLFFPGLRSLPRKK